MFLIITPPGKKDGALRHLTDEETQPGKVNSTFEKQQSWDWPQGGSDFLVCPMGIPASEEHKPKIGWCFYTVDLKPTPTFPNNEQSIVHSRYS